jgi:hypothetical protein
MQYVQPDGYLATPPTGKGSAIEAWPSIKANENPYM